MLPLCTLDNIQVLPHAETQNVYKIKNIDITSNLISDHDALNIELKCE